MGWMTDPGRGGKWKLCWTRRMRTALSGCMQRRTPRWGSGPFLRNCAPSGWGKPVSYTHLDVYKRQMMDRAGRRRKMEAYLQRLRQMESVADFDESLFAGTVDQVIVYPGQEKNQKRLTFRWKDGSETPVTI